tara:strand:+ start:1369 stop:1887 length:519 start_codon:yes stop_codon:yes gene_type:complete
MSKSKKDGVVLLHGREYKTVALRVHEFRVNHPISDGWAILTEIVTAGSDVVVFKATIVSPDGKPVATGFAEEKRGNRGIMSTSALEVCETSAIGRALAAAGLAGTEYASADEVANAISQQNKSFYDRLKSAGHNPNKVFEHCMSNGWGNPEGWAPDKQDMLLRDLGSGKVKP